ncbi:MAG TPA: glycosyltransferase family 39 protein [Pricia sp.]|nr:glycosyltransferase family 39 protein [Pricia sp.]
MKTKLPRIFLLLLAAVFLLNLLQSYVTPLIFDEAYYWYYAQDLAWGYFDHPPMVALMIKLGGLLFDGELGVRVVSCILSTGTFYVLWATIDLPKKGEYVIHFFVLVFSMALLNAYGFLTLPDTPLLFFTALFLYVYKRFLQEASLRWAVLMGVIMAALMYSKYHAALIILFVLLSNLGLVKNKYAWLSVFVALLCYAPHFYWLYQNDFISINYHLFNRPNAPYSFQKYTLGYLLNLVVLFGLTFPWIYWSLFKSKASDRFTKALLYLVYGVLIFFFISSFNRRVQTQWIIIITIPLAILAFRYMMANATARKWILRMGTINILIILYLRVGLVYEPLSPIYYETHGNKELAEAIQSEVGDMPLVFENSYRDASMFAFYTGNRTYSLNNHYYRRNQYSIDDSESKIQHQKVLYLTSYPRKAEITFTKSNGGTFYGEYITDFESFRKLRVFIEGPVNLDTGRELDFKVYNPYDRPIDLDKLRFNVAYLNDFKQFKGAFPANPKPRDTTVMQLPARDTVNFKLILPKPRIKHPGYLRIGISGNGLPFGLNSDNIALK